MYVGKLKDSETRKGHERRLSENWEECEGTLELKT